MLSEILSAVREWLHRAQLPAEILMDRVDALRVVFETENALAELTVAEPICAPCRFVAFLVLDTRLDVKAEPVYCFYDDETSTIDDILQALDRGVAWVRSI